MNGIPPQRSRLLRLLGRGVLRLLGWRISGRMPAERKFVAVLAPHTSNWDFLISMAALFELGLRMQWFGKHTLFRGPLGPLLRWLGGEAVDRSAPDGAVATALERFRTREQYVLGLAPEGTRRRAETWKTGFHRIARAAGVPIVPVGLDYRTRSIVIGEPIRPGEDAAADIARIRSLYHRGMAKYPEQFAEP